MIYLVRHGQTDWNRIKVTQGDTDVPLNEMGIKQAEVASDAIKDIHIDKIYSSDLSRAEDTATIINDNHNCEIIIDKRLREFDFGDIEGLPEAYMSEETRYNLNNNPEKINAESKEDVYNRVKDFFQSINLDEDILIVSHAGVMGIILYYLRHNDHFDKDLFEKEAKYYSIGNANIYKVEIIKK